MPCRRSWVRVPSSALRSPLETAGFFISSADPAPVVRRDSQPLVSLYVLPRGGRRRAFASQLRGREPRQAPCADGVCQGMLQKEQARWDRAMVDGAGRRSDLGLPQVPRKADPGAAPARLWSHRELPAANACDSSQARCRLRTRRRDARVEQAGRDRLVEAARTAARASNQCGFLGRDQSDARSASAAACRRALTSPSSRAARSMRSCCVSARSCASSARERTASSSAFSFSTDRVRSANWLATISVSSRATLLPQRDSTTRNQRRSSPQRDSRPRRAARTEPPHRRAGNVAGFDGPREVAKPRLFASSSKTCARALRSPMSVGRKDEGRRLAPTSAR